MLQKVHHLNIFGGTDGYLCCMFEAKWKMETTLVGKMLLPFPF